MKSTAKILFQALLIVLLGSGLGLLWNLFNPRALPLTSHVPTGSTAGPIHESHLWDAARHLPPGDRISAEEAYRHYQDGRVFFIDARSPSEHAERQIAAARNIDEKHISQGFKDHYDAISIQPPPHERAEYPTGYPIIVYCNNRFCDQGATVLKRLKEWRLQNVRLLTEGLDGWMARGYEVYVLQGGKLVPHSGADIPRASDTGVAWLSPGVWFSILVLLPWLLLGLAACLVHGFPRVGGASATGAGVLGRLGLGGVFLFASYFKLHDPAGFAQMVLCYDLVPHALVPLFTVCLPAVEALAGLLLVAGLWTRPASLILLVLLAVFTAAIFALMLQNRNCACGCFPGEYPVSWIRLYEDAAFSLAALLALWRGHRALALDTWIHRHRSPRQQTPRG